MQLQHVEADGVQLEYLHLPGPAEQPTIVLLHEGLGCVALWRDFPRTLHQCLGLSVFAYSRAGYGGSDAVVLPRPASYMHDEALVTLPKVLATAGIQSAILVGHSDGGSIALVAPSGPARERICAIVTLAAHAFVEPESIQGIRATGLAYDGLDGSNLRERLERYHGARVDCAFRGWHDSWLDPAFSDWNIEAYLANVKVPALVLQGEEDEYGSAAQVKAIATGVGGPVESAILPDCSHAVYRDQPGLLIDNMRRFLEQHRIAHCIPCVFANSSEQALHRT